jgi:hypothetical protein
MKRQPGQFGWEEDSRSCFSCFEVDEERCGVAARAVEHIEDFEQPTTSPTRVSRFEEQLSS